MKTPQITPDWETGIWNGRTIMTDQTEEPRCPQCGAMSRWEECCFFEKTFAVSCDPCKGKVEAARAGWQAAKARHLQRVAAECDTCESRWNETTTETERTAR